MFSNTCYSTETALCSPLPPSPETAIKKEGQSCLYTDLPLATMSSLSSGHQVGRAAKLGLVCVSTTGFPRNNESVLFN